MTLQNETRPDLLATGVSSWLSRPEEPLEDINADYLYDRYTHC
ncbi:hypothetical protein JCM39194_24270 [Desulfotomaculum varum]